MSSLRILIVDDHEAVLRGVRSLLSSRHDWLVCGEARDGVEAVEKAKTLRPDLVLMDVSMPRMDGVQATRIIRREVPESKVVIVSQNDPTLVARQAAEVDASGYVAKNDLLRQLLPTVDRLVAESNSTKPKADQESPPGLHVVAAEQVAGALKDAELARQAKLLDLSFNAVILRDAEDRITYWNKGAEELYGWTRDEVLGQVTHNLFQTNFPEPLPSIVERLHREKRWQGELIHTLKNGKSLTVLSRWALTHDHETNSEVIMEANIDITQSKEATRASNLLAAIVGSSDDAIISKSLGGMITSWNKAAERMFGYTAEEAIGRHITLIIPADRRDEEIKILDRLRRGERIDHFETIRVRKDGALLDISLTISPVKDAAGSIVGASKVARDITERRRTERALRESEERFRAIVETTPECVKLVASDGTLLHMNPPGLTVVGADSPEKVVGKSVYDLIAPHDRDRFRAFNERICRGEKASLEFEMVALDGACRHMETHAAPLRMADGSIVQLAVTRDITERVWVQQQLRKSEEGLRTLADQLERQVHSRTRELEVRNAEVVQQSEQLRELSNRLLQTQDDERRHIARELHDSAGQIITALGMNLASMTQHVRKNPMLGKALDDSQTLVQQLNKEIRTTSYLLHPPLLDENGLPEAIRWYLHGLMERSGLSVDLDIADGFGRLPSEIELALFRIVQECLTNIHRHSGSKSATIRLSRTADSVALEVKDQGKGIPSEKLDGIRAQRSGIGITGMRERIRHFNGAIQIHSGPTGTRISITLPLPATDTTEPEDTPPGQTSRTAA
jgi:PAS domain S-box-containing protein